MGTVLVCMPGVRVGCVQTVNEERRERCNMAGEASAAGKSRAEKGREKRAWGELIEARYSGGATGDI